MIELPITLEGQIRRMTRRLSSGQKGISRPNHPKLDKLPNSMLEISDARGSQSKLTALAARRQFVRATAVWMSRTHRRHRRATNGASARASSWLTLIVLLTQLIVDSSLAQVQACLASGDIDECHVKLWAKPAEFSAPANH